MKLRFRIATLVVLGVLLSTVVSCAGSTVEVEVNCEYLERISVFTDSRAMKPDQKIEIIICSNPTTGYSWDYEIGDESVIGYVSNEYRDPDSDMVGAGGTEIWVFRAIKKGNTTVTLTYRRPWEEGVSPERTYAMNIAVKD